MLKNTKYGTKSDCCPHRAAAAFSSDPRACFTCGLAEAVVVEPDGVVGVCLDVLQVSAEELHACRAEVVPGRGKRADEEEEGPELTTCSLRWWAA